MTRAGYNTVEILYINGFSLQGYWQPANDTNEYHVAIKVLKDTSPGSSKELLQVCILNSFLFMFTAWPGGFATWLGCPKIALDHVHIHVFIGDT